MQDLLILCINKSFIYMRYNIKWDQTQGQLQDKESLYLAIQIQAESHQIHPQIIVVYQEMKYTQI